MLAIRWPYPKSAMSPCDVRQLSASAKKLSIIMVCIGEDLRGTDRTKKCIKKVPK